MTDITNSPTLLALAKAHGGLNEAAQAVQAAVQSAPGTGNTGASPAAEHQPIRRRRAPCTGRGIRAIRGGARMTDITNSPTLLALAKAHGGLNEAAQAVQAAVQSAPGTGNTGASPAAEHQPIRPAVLRAAQLARDAEERSHVCAARSPSSTSPACRHPWSSTRRSTPTAISPASMARRST